MISSRHRFHGYNIVQRIYARSRVINGKYMSLRYAKRTSGKPYRIAVVVGRKVSKSAVVRNKIRRRFFEMLRQQINIPESHDLIFNIHNDKITQLNQAELNENIKNLLNKLN